MSAHAMGEKGKPCLLNAEQQRELVDEVSTGRFRTAADIRQWIESEYGVCYTRNQHAWAADQAGVQPQGAEAPS